jgi:O-antigen/teichoic acid export membrane protein
MIPIVCGLGLSVFVTREVAAGKTVREVLGTVLPISLVLGLVGAAGGWFLADALSPDNGTVRTFLRIAFLLAPVSLVAGVLQAILAGQQLWDRLLLARAIPTGIAIVAIPALYALDALTVGTAATVTIVGGLATIVPTLGLLRQAWMSRWNRAYSRSALSFGARAWAGGLANITNLRFDQVLMIALTTDSQLGLYAVAVTVATAPAIVPVAVAGPVQARVAAGDHGIVARATRTTIALVAVLHIFAGALAVPVVTVLFGPEFSASIVMIWVLLGGGVPFAGGILLSAVLSADGAPGRTAVAQFAALGATVPLVLVLVPGQGGLGAALASVVAYSISFIVLGWATVRRGLALGPRELLVPRREDVTWLFETARAWLGGLRARREGPVVDAQQKPNDRP